MGADLASRTELELSKEMVKMGAIVHFICPHDDVTGVFDMKDGPNFTSFGQLRIPGLATLSGGLKIPKIVSEIGGEFDFCLVDWRMIRFCVKQLKRVGLKWSLIDRGPPAFPGFLPKIQKLQWRNSWHISSNNSKLGFVVSERHGDLVRRETRFSGKLVDIQAGVPDHWCDSADKKEPRGELIFCYSGAIDRLRGLEEIVRLADHIIDLEIPSRILVLGTGDYAGEIKKQSLNRSNLEYLGVISDPDDVEAILQKCHVGIMPMPDKEIWNISSAIKLPEYLSKGMIIMGKDHPGNRRGQGDFYLLSEGDWVVDGINMISNLLESGKWRDISCKSNKKSKQMTWSVQARRLLDCIEDTLSNH